MNLLNRTMSYDKTKVNQENCNCEECVGINDVSEKKEIVENFRFADDFLRKIENYRMMHREKELLTIINLKYWYKDNKTKTFIWKALHVHGDKYDYSNVKYIKSMILVEIICRVEGHEPFPQTPANHLQGEGCPSCRESKGEMKIRIFLTNNDIRFEREKRFEDCRDKKPLPFDFYLPQYNLCIEFDGKQHFIPTSFNFLEKENDDKKLKNLKRTQHHDQIKNDYCKNNGINLLRIKYDEDIEQKLTEYFKGNDIKI